MKSQLTERSDVSCCLPAFVKTSAGIRRSLKNAGAHERRRMNLTQGQLRPRDLIRDGAARLGERPSARRTCELLLSELLAVGRTALYLEKNYLSEDTTHQFLEILEGVKAGQPLQYLLGRATFMGDSFQVTSACFIPRPETEILVEACLDYFGDAEKQRNKETKPFLFVDLGTGSGCIAISLTKRISCCKMLAIDLMEEALNIARRNGQYHGVSDRILWISGDLFGPLGRPLAIDAVLSNPPYIPSEQLNSLSPEVYREPRISLEGGKSGLHFYRRIAEEAPPFLKDGGLVFLEIGDCQEGPVTEIFVTKGSFHLLEIRKDLSGTPRLMIFRKGRYG